MRILVIALLVGCHTADECERAVARLERISAHKHPIAPRSLLDECRDPKVAKYDPVLRCAIDSSSDQTASDCIDAFVKAVVKEPVGSDGGDGKGLNPLLE